MDLKQFCERGEAANLVEERDPMSPHRQTNSQRGYIMRTIWACLAISAAALMAALPRDIFAQPPSGNVAQETAEAKDLAASILGAKIQLTDGKVIVTHVKRGHSRSCWGSAR